MQDTGSSHFGFWIEKKVKNKGVRDSFNEKNFYRS